MSQTSAPSVGISTLVDGIPCPTCGPSDDGDDELDTVQACVYRKLTLTTVKQSLIISEQMTIEALRP